LWRSGVSFAASINSRARLPRFDALLTHKRTNEFAEHEQLRGSRAQSIPSLTCAIYLNIKTSTFC
jgi:hypothetical protein